MSASLVGSEMCIRDSLRAALDLPALADVQEADLGGRGRGRQTQLEVGRCLLYTSDAADDM
eukprot:2000523-Alexandrium_andersonii.AAC.1